VARRPRSGHVTLHLNSARGNLWRSSVVKDWQGGTDVEVPAMSIKEAWDRDAYFKIDIEGAEMEILETMIAAGKRCRGLVYEWSFDVDRSIPRFVAVRDGLRKMYPIVNHGKVNEEEPVWLPSWFPPLRLVWAGHPDKLKEMRKS
jgi:hypothetical protein